jgi:AAA domain/UvrD-like helicase C-terminal domain
MIDQNVSQTLTGEQMSILQRFTTTQESFRVEAPPGAGKTHLLAQMLLATEQPVLVVMFTSTAQKQLVKRLQKFPDAAKHKITTLHALAHKLTEICWEWLGFTKKPRHISDNERAITDESQFRLAQISARRIKGLFTHNDALFYLLGILRGKGFRLRYPALLVDEYQDTNAIQWQIIEALMHQGPQRLILLGDRFQCIFQFLKAWADHPLAVGLPEERLSYSHRCRERIASFASQITGVTFRGAPGGIVQLHNYGRTQEFCVQAVQLIQKREAKTSAILCRSNQTVEEVRAYLASCRIPVAGRSTPQAVQFWNHPAILWAMDLLEDPLAHWPIALRYLGLNRAFTSLEALEHPPSDLSCEEAARAVQFARAISAMVDAPTVRDSLELIDFLLKLPPDWPDYLFTLKKQLGQIRTYQDLLHLRDTKVEPFHASGVEVLTIHAAKGREWQHVLVDAALPKNARWSEQKFVAYVAVTRAQDFLDIFCPCWGNAWEVIDYFAFD